MLRTNFAGALLLCCALTVSGQTQLTDIQFNKNPGSGRPDNFQEFNGNLYFTATTPQTGQELWKTDGTGAGSSMVKDINLGINSSISSNLLPFKGKLYFIATDGLVSGYQLWETDGTAVGTKRVTNGPSIYTNKLVATASGIFFLVAVNATATLQVWVSDGTAPGTKLVRGDMTLLNSAENLTVVGDNVFFSLPEPGTNDSRVWRSDGTPEGTFAVSDVLYGNGAGPGGSQHPTQFTVFNGELYFLSRGETLSYDNGIIKSDGTSAGTVPVASLYPGYLIDYDAALVHNGRLYFSLFEADQNHYMIWSTQGTDATTRLEYNYYSDAYFAPSNMVVVGNNIYFTSGNAEGGMSLVRFNPATQTATDVKTLKTSVIRPFIFSQSAYADNRITVVGNNLYIGLYDDLYRYRNQEMWVSDGTTDGTFAIPNTGILSATKFGTQLYFSGTRENETELYTSDGTIAGTKLVKNINPSEGPPSIHDLCVLNDVTLFAALDPDHGVELWKTDGTPGGTSVLVDIVPGANSGYYSELQHVGDRAFFLGSTGNSNIEVFVTDGTAEGTQAITNLSNTQQYVEQPLVAVGDNKIFFVLRYFDGTDALYVTNGTPGNATEVLHLAPNEYGIGRIDGMLAVGNMLYFIAAGNGEDLWKSDGTPGGTVKVSDFSSIETIRAAGQHVYVVELTSYDPSVRTLKKCDGVTDAVTPLLTLHPSSVATLTTMGDKIFFNNSDAEHGQELWVSDGTVDGTKILKDIYAGASSSFLSWAGGTHEGSLYFAAADGTHGTELWKTDGTAAGTSLVADILPGAEGSRPYAMASAGSALYFTAYTPEKGFEVWSTDGQQDTHMVADVVPGATYSNPEDYVAFDDNVLFLAMAESGRAQLWTTAGLITDIEKGEHTMITAYPNPSSGILNLDAPDMAGATVSIFTTTGYCVQRMPVSSASTQVDLKDLPSGVYVVQYVKGAVRYTSKIVKR
jgi:trimeric autotransporter adhesin